MTNKHPYKRSELLEMRHDYEEIPYEDFCRKWHHVFLHGMVCQTAKELNKMLKERDLREIKR